MIDAQLREELAKPGLRDDYRSVLISVVGERESASREASRLTKIEDQRAARIANTAAIIAAIAAIIGAIIATIGTIFTIMSYLRR